MRSIPLSRATCALLGTALAVGLAACSSSPAPPRVASRAVAAPAESTGQPLTAFTLTDLEVFDLKIPSDFFTRAGRALPDAPDVDVCHIQGIAIDRGLLVASCILFDPGQPEKQTTSGRSLVLTAPLCDIVGCDGHPPRTPDWHAREITEPIPVADCQRITRQRLKKTELSDDERAVVHIMNHPSGMMLDPQSGGVWVGNAGYAKDTYAHIMLLDSEFIGQPSGRERLVRKTYAMPHHTSAIAVVDGRYLVIPLHATERWAIVDTRYEQAGTKQFTVVPNPLMGTKDYVHISDCDIWRGSVILCGGEVKYKAREGALHTPLESGASADDARAAIRVRQGRLQILQVDVTRYPTVDIRLLGYMRAEVSTGSAPTTSLGMRAYRKLESGEEVFVHENDYAGYKTPLTLTFEGMTLSPDRQYIYFLPHDLPDSRLLRMRLSASPGPR